MISKRTSMDSEKEGVIRFRSLGLDSLVITSLHFPQTYFDDARMLYILEYRSPGRETLQFDEAGLIKLDTLEEYFGRIKSLEDFEKAKEDFWENHYDGSQEEER